MQIKYKGIIFNELTIEKVSGEVIDISKIDKAIELKNIIGAWGYICKECSVKYNFKIHAMEESIKDMICYVYGCKSKEGVVDFYIEGEEIKKLKFI